MISSLVALTASASFSGLTSRVHNVVDWLHGLQQPITAPARLEKFIAREEPFAWNSLLCNIGPDGCNANGVSLGVVIASPERVDPDVRTSFAGSRFKPFTILTVILSTSTLGRGMELW